MKSENKREEPTLDIHGLVVPRYDPKEIARHGLTRLEAERLGINVRDPDGAEEDPEPESEHRRMMDWYQHGRRR